MHFLFQIWKFAVTGGRADCTDVNNDTGSLGIDYLEQLPVDQEQPWQDGGDITLKLRVRDLCPTLNLPTKSDLRGRGIWHFSVRACVCVCVSVCLRVGGRVDGGVGVKVRKKVRQWQTEEKVKKSGWGLVGCSPPPPLQKNIYESKPHHSTLKYLLLNMSCSE